MTAGERPWAYGWPQAQRGTARAVRESTRVSTRQAKSLRHAGGLRLASREALAEISRLSYRARSLLCKPPIGRQTASCEGAGRRAEFRGTGSPGWAGSAPAHAASGGPQSSGQRGGTWAGRRLRRSAFSVVFIHSPLADRPRFVADETAGRKGADPPSWGVIHESADCGTAIDRGPVRSFTRTIAD